MQSISSLESLSKILPFLSGVQNLDPTVVGIIQGILPAVALAILIALVPIIFTHLSKFEGIPQKSFVDLSVLHKYFFFQVIFLDTYTRTHSHKNDIESYVGYFFLFFHSM